MQKEEELEIKIEMELETIDAGKDKGNSGDKSSDSILSLCGSSVRDVVDPSRGK